MFRLFILIVLVLAAACTSTVKKQDINSFADIAKLKVAQSKAVLLNEIKRLNVRRATLKEKVLAFRLSQYGVIKYSQSDEFALPLLKSSFFLADISIGKKAVAYTQYALHALHRVKFDTCGSSIIAYYYALNLGLILKEKGLLELSKLPKIHNALLCAIKNPDIDSAGPLRVLGYLYLKAPSWPQGIGDIEKALQYLKQAIDLDKSFPENYIFYAEALRENDEPVKAKVLLEKAEVLLDPIKWGKVHVDRWKKHISKLRTK